MKKKLPILAILLISFCLFSTTIFAQTAPGDDGSGGDGTPPDGGGTAVDLGYKTVPSTITSNFNGTPIAGDRTIWFNSQVTIKNHTDNSVLFFKESTITFSSGGVDYNLAVPKTQISFVPASDLPNNTATYFFDESVQTWIIKVPQSYQGNIFLSGLAFKVPSAGLPGGINPVKWNAGFSTNETGVKIQWQWAAAVYTNFTTDYNQLNVVVTPGGRQNGTPLNYTGYVVGGARGGGGSNYTGSWSGTQGFNLRVSPLETSSSNQSSGVGNTAISSTKDLQSAFSKSSAISINTSKSPISGLTVKSVYPNPFVDRINISIQSETNTQATIGVYDYSGKMIKLENIALQKGISNVSVNDLSKISKGAYLLEVKTGDAILISKLKR